MSQVLATTIPIFLLIAAGYGAARAGLIDPADVRTLGRFVLNFALPALIVRALAGRRMSELTDLRYVAVYGAASLTVFALVFAIARFVRGRSQAASASGMTKTFSMIMLKDRATPAGAPTKRAATE